MHALDEELAPRWHTAVLVGLIVAVAVTGTWLAGRGSVPAAPAAVGSRITVVYLPMIVVAWGLVIYVARVGRNRNALPLLLGTRWVTLRRATTDVGLATLGYFVIVGSELAWTALADPGRTAAASAVLPHTLVERLAWVVVAASVGFSEEVVYRGYLQRQLGAFTGSFVLGILGQAVLFGIAHAEQGWLAVPRLAMYGLALGALAHFRKSLLPGIVCHVAIDATSALI